MDNAAGIQGYELNEYKIVLAPHEDLAKRILHIRQDFHDKYKLPGIVNGIPQLLLVRFKQIQPAEERIINRLHLVAMAAHSIKVELKDFGSYPSHTVFLNVLSKVAVGDLVKKIREDGQRLMKPDNDNKPHFIMDAQMTIAMKLKPWQYEQGWLEYSHKHFTARFIAHTMILLKRRPGEFKYAPIGSFEFQNLPVDIKQGELF